MWTPLAEGDDHLSTSISARAVANSVVPPSRAASMPAPAPITAKTSDEVPARAAAIAASEQALRRDGATGVRERSRHLSEEGRPLCGTRYVVR